MNYPENEQSEISANDNIKSNNEGNSPYRKYCAFNILTQFGCPVMILLNTDIVFSKTVLLHGSHFSGLTKFPEFSHIFFPQLFKIFCFSTENLTH